MGWWLHDTRKKRLKFYHQIFTRWPPLVLGNAKFQSTIIYFDIHVMKLIQCALPSINISLVGSQIISAFSDFEMNYNHVLLKFDYTLV